MTERSLPASASWALDLMGERRLSGSAFTLFANETPNPLLLSFLFLLSNDEHLIIGE
jgi:hypothetical protein